jgi:hypothetical protein
MHNRTLSSILGHVDTAPLTLQPIRCLDDLLPGDVGFSTINGRLGRGISLCQALLRDECIFTHAYLIIGGGHCVEAMPRGARIVPITGDNRLPPRWGPQFAYGRIPLSASQRAQMDLLARWGTTGANKRFTRALKGRPYAFDDYLALALWEWGFPGGRRLRRKIASSDRLICSQLVDFAWTTVGYHLFDDGRLCGDVTPGQLFWQVLRRGLITVPAV